MEIPNYFIQTADKALHAYWRLDILLVDLASNKRIGEVPMTILKLVRYGGTVGYSPITEEELHKERVA